MSALVPRAASGGAPSERRSVRPALEDLRAALKQLLAAERRLRGRELPGELAHGHIRSLRALSEQGEMTAGQLARDAELTPASVTAMLDHLEAAGIVRRARSTRDRRVCNVSLTERGHAVLGEKLARWQALWEERIGQYDDDELAVAGRVLCDIATLFDSVPGPGGDAGAVSARSELVK